MKSPTTRLVTGLVFTLVIIGAYAAYTLLSVKRMRELESDTVDRNRRASLQLIRIQSDLNALALAMRDMLDAGAGPDAYPLTAWKAPLLRIRQNLDDAIAREAELAAGRKPEQTAFLRSTFVDFWNAADQVLATASQPGRGEAEARASVRTVLQPKQEALSALVARLLVERNNEESRGGQQVEAIFANIEANAYRFLIVSIVLIVLTSASLIRSNRELFLQLAALAEQRRELTRQLISTQESTFRAISRDLHDEFGQILTALGAMLRRADRLAPETKFHEQLQEATATVQGTLDNIRSLSQSLQPVILEEQGLLAAIEWHLPVFERQTGIAVRYMGTRDGSSAASGILEENDGIHVFRILQESLNNVARHSGADAVAVCVEQSPSMFSLTVEDRGRGIAAAHKPGVGLTGMRERAALIGAELTIENLNEGGTRVMLRKGT